MPADTLVIVNPSSGYGAAGRRLPALEDRLRDALGDLEVERTRGPGDAERLAREGARAGAERVVVFGGDGTLREVVCGILAADLGAQTQIGIVPLGTGGDFARGLGIPRDPGQAIARLAEGKSLRVDAGRVTWRAPDGRDVRSYFLNVAGFGMSGLVSQRVNASKKTGGPLSYLLATLRGVATYRCRAARIEVDGECVHDGPVLFAAAANGSYFGAGMRVAPEARPDDGLLDMVIVAEMSKLGMVRRIPRLYAGTHLELPEVTCVRGRRMQATAPDGGELFLDVDGEAPGTLPASFEILPGAIGLFGA